MTLDHAKKIVAACEVKAHEIGIPMVISVVDEGANLVLQERMDGAMIAGITLAQDKAYTAAATGFDTHQIAPLVQPGKIAYGLAGMDRGRLVVFPGGLTLKSGDKTIGAVGVAGGMADQDQEVAQAGRKAL
ncbi:MAG: heme-binding protein [Candidatus Wildermuthbacteria bacterium]|nr:heme-binding protein [Candidatus Wildermuthbacteria bacterium]